jgi:transmembrane sensor
MTEDELWTLLVRHTSGRATADDAERLRAYMEADPARADLVRRAEQVATASRRPVRDADSEQSWNALRARLLREPRLPAERVPRFEVSSGRARWLGRSLAAAAVLAAVGVGAVAWERGALRRNAPLAMKEYRTARGEREEITLADGSRITLGAASRLRVPEHFGARRDVQLEGQAFFRVAHDPAHPFVVHASNAAVQAIGTSFEVRRYAEDTSVRVVVAEGRVALRAEDASAGASALLTRGDVGELNARGTVAHIRRDAPLDAYLGWLGGRLAYRLTPLSTVIADLGRWYDVDVHVADSGRVNARISVVLPANDADAAGQLLAEVLGLRYERSGRVMTLTDADP